MQQTLTEETKDRGADLQGKVALVTGAGRGLGAAICQVLSRAGATVVGADVRSDLMDEVARQIHSWNGKCEGLTLDVGDEREARRAVQDVADRHGRLDILINNAGVDKTVSIEELSVEDWDRVIQVNLRAPFLMSKFALSIMRNQKRGHIVNIVSTAAKRAWANASAYHASKWGLLGFSHALHVEARAHKVKVTAVISGGMRTPFLLDRFPDIDLDNLQDPLNVANAVLFALQQPEGTVIPEMMVLPMRETSWP